MSVEDIASGMAEERRLGTADRMKMYVEVYMHHVDVFAKVAVRRNALTPIVAALPSVKSRANSAGKLAFPLWSSRL